MWSFVDTMLIAEDPHDNLRIQDIGVWLIQETSMNSTAQAYNIRNNEYEGRRCFYNQKDITDLMTMLGKKMSTGAEHHKHMATQRAVFLRCDDGREMYVLATVHLPTSWRSDKDLQEALEEMTHCLEKLTKNQNDPTIITGGDLNADSHIVDMLLKCEGGEGAGAGWRISTLVAEWSVRWNLIAATDANGPEAKEPTMKSKTAK